MSDQDFVDEIFEKEIVTEILQKCSPKLGVESVLSVEAFPAVAKNENFGSNILRLSVTCKNSNGEKVKKSVILKQKRIEKSSVDLSEALGIFKRETLVYNHYLNAMETLAAKHNDNEETIWPRIITAVENKVFLEDLKDQGYQLTAKHKGHDMNHATLVIKSLARLHATSLAAKQENLINTEQLEPFIMANDLEFMTNFVTKGIDTMVTAMKSWGEDWNNVAIKLKNITKNVGAKLKELNVQSKGKYDVFNHGDCWSSNIMFKYIPETNTPIGIKLVDFQISHFNSPGWDLNYYLNNSLKLETKNRELENLLRIYSDTLKLYCDKLGYKGKVLNLDEVKEVFDEVSFFGMVIRLTHTPIMIASAEKDFKLDVDEYIEEGDLSSDYFKHSTVVEATKETLKDFIKKNIL